MALNGTIINPGQEFSFNETTGARTEAKGYKPATAYLNGEVVQEPGGGYARFPPLYIMPLFLQDLRVRSAMRTATSRPM